jgi:hypothetical protein
MKVSRRNFLSKSALAAVSATALTGLSFGASAQTPEQPSYVHHVVYWMKNPDSAEDLDKLVAGLKKLCSVKIIKFWQVGKPVAYNKDVMEKSFAVSLLMVFDQKSDLDVYHADPIHQEFVKECGQLWGKKIGFGSVNA